MEPVESRDTGLIFAGILFLAVLIGLAGAGVAGKTAAVYLGSGLVCFITGLLIARANRPDVSPTKTLAWSYASILVPFLTIPVAMLVGIWMVAVHLKTKRSRIEMQAAAELAR